jgi:hypothetical protein
MHAALIHPYVVEIQKLKEEIGRKDMQIEILNQRLGESEKEIQFVKKSLKITSADLTRKNFKLQQFLCNEAFFENNDARTRHFTGLTTWSHLKTLYEFVEPHMKSGTKLSKFQCLILTLLRLRTGSTARDSGYRFDVNDKTAGKIFYQVLNMLSQKLMSFVYWPTREELAESTPECFRASFGNCITIILDCFEIRAERASALKANGQMYSSYKGGQTVKVLIGITPSGIISFVSEGFSGHCSDKYVTNNSGVLDKLENGDVVMVDKGFTISDEVTARDAKLVIPAFRKSGFQMDPIEVEKTRKIANVRIHVERVIGALRQKYEVLNSRLPIYFLSSHNKDVPVINKIILVCSALLNCCPSVVPPV